MATEKEELATKLASAAVVFDHIKHELRMDWRSEDSKDAAYRAAFRVARVGPIAVILLGPVVVLTWAICVNKDINFAALSLLWAFVLGPPYVITIAIVAGRVAHRFAYETAVSSLRLAKLLAWIANLSVWAWCAIFLMRYG